jgi:competence protein ComEC
MQDNAFAHSEVVQREAQVFAAYPLALLATAFALGILGTLFFVTPLWLLVIISALATLLSTAAGLKRKKGSAILFLSLAVFFLGTTLAAIERNNVPATQLKRLLNEGTIAIGEPVELTGMLAQDPEVAPERLYLFLKVQNVRFRGTEREASGVVVVFAPISGESTQREFDQLDLRYGARLRVMTTLERADTFRNPGVSLFTEYLDRKGYDATGFVKSPLLIERLENERVFLPLAWLYQWRRNLQTEIDARFSTETAGVLDAALLGNRHRLSRSTSERFREGGTFHVLVISGLHITFLGGFVFLIARRLTKNSALQFILASTVLWAYSLAVGAESSVLRAAIMFTVVLLAPLLSRRASSLNALGAAALALLAWRPSDLFDPSFQLTFVSVIAIVILAWPVLEKMAAVGSWKPTRETPYPPSCVSWLRSISESLFWSECKAQRELERANYNYKLFKAPLAGTLERLHIQRLLRYSFGAITVSICVQLALLPFLIIYFHRLSLASFLLNIGVSLMMAVVAITAGVALLLAQVSAAVAAPIISLANILNWAMVHSVDPFAKVGVASIRLPEYTGWSGIIYVLYYLPLATLAFSLSRWMPLSLPGSNSPTSWSFTSQRSSIHSDVSRRIVWLAMVAQLFAIALIIFHPFSAASSQGKLRIDFLDVGQGDSALVTFPDNTTLLIDGGGRPGPFLKDNGNIENGDEETFAPETRSVGEFVVSEYLWWRGLHHVDYILATHADADHIDGLNDVARNFSVRAALVARTPDRDLEYARFSKTLSRENIPLRLIGAGDVLQFGEVTARVLWPLPCASSEAGSRNNDSIVLRFHLGERAVLFTGDIERAGETAMLEAQDNLHADVVKVPHHGSKTSSTAILVATVEARVAVISVGQTSIFSHPSKEVVERWKAGGAQVLITGQTGTITITTNGQSLSLETFVKQR